MQNKNYNSESFPIIAAKTICGTNSTSAMFVSNCLGSWYFNAVWFHLSHCYQVTRYDTFLIKVKFKFLFEENFA